MPELTPRDDIKKAVSEILKRVDQMLKSGDLDQAMREISKARELDPKNVYVHAYEERMAAMAEERRVTAEIDAKRQVEEEKRRKVELDKRKAEDEKRKAAEESRRKAEEQRKQEEAKKKQKDEEERKREDARKRAEEEQHREIEARKREEEFWKKIDAQRKRWEEEGKGPKGGPASKKLRPISSEVLEETKRKILEERKAKSSAAQSAVSHGQAYREGLDLYRRVLIEVWNDGAATASEEEQLKHLRSALFISPQDHETMEKEAKVEAYAQAFRRAWSTGAISPQSASALADLRKKFRITMEEHEQIEAKLLWELRASGEKARLLIIDDDEKLLKVIADTLEDAGYQIVAVTTTDEAFQFLRLNTPDLIVSDINLETSTMGGFSFYEKVQEIERLHDIPFIFLSGLTDEVLIRTGKELGVDDYLTKPFSDETLIAIIKGKLKRYRQLRKSRQKK